MSERAVLRIAVKSSGGDNCPWRSDMFDILGCVFNQPDIRHIITDGGPDTETAGGGATADQDQRLLILSPVCSYPKC